MIYVLALISISVAVFGRWVTRAGRAPRWTAWLAYGQLATTIATGGYAWWRLNKTFESIGDVNPADRQAILSADIRTAMIALAIGSVIALIVAITLGVFWLISTPRSSASSSPPSPSP
jgi:hypothetical protein